MKEVQYIDKDFLAPKDAWDALPFIDKAEEIKTGVRDGLTNLNDIRQRYNKYAEGGGSNSFPDSWTMEDESAYRQWLNKLPDNLKYTDDNVYDMRIAFKAGMEPVLNEDGYYHLGSRDPQTGRILKAPIHPTYLQAIVEDARMGYYPTVDDKGVTYTNTWKGNIYKGGGSVVDDSLIDLIIKEEGFNEKPEDIGDGKITLGSGLTNSKWHDLYKRRGNVWSEADNRNAVRSEAADREQWAMANIPNWRSLPDSAKKALLLYKYNFDFNRANSPKLFAALEAGNLREAARQMDATSKDPKFQKGLADRRKREQALFLSEVPVAGIAPRDITIQSPVSTAIYNPYVLEQQNTVQLPQYVPVQNEYVRTVELSPEQQKAMQLQERFNQINRFNQMMKLFGIENTAIPAFMPESGITALDNIWDNEYRKGGRIHIKPSHRGRLTELKKRTGKSEAELYRTGSPATRKMITFARNARKWKHGLGGNLYDGTSQPTQKMNIFRRPNGEYFYQASPESDEITVVPRIQVSDDPAYWTYVDAEGKLYTPQQSATPTQGTIVEKEDEGPIVEAAKNYLGELQYDINNGIPIGGKYTMPAIAATALLPLTGEAFAGTSMAGIPATTWADAALTSGFGAHGLHHWANEGIDDWGDAAMTALEVAPLGRLARPIAKETALAVENYRYPLGRPQVPNDYLTVKPQVRTKVGDVEIDNPNLLYHLDRGDRTGAFSSQGAYVEDGILFPGTPKDDTAIPYSWWNKGKPYATNVGGQPMTRLITTTEDTPGMLHVRSQNYPIGQWNGRRGFVTNAEYINPEGVDVSGSTYTLDPNYGWRRVFAEDTPAAEWAQMNTTKNTGTADTPWTLEQAQTAVNYSKDFFTNDVLPRLLKSREGSSNPYFTQNSPFLGKFLLTDKPSTVLGETNPIIQNRNGSKYTVEINKRDKSPFNDKLDTVIREMREDMIHYHKGMLDDDIQAALKHIDEYNKAVEQGDRLKAAKLMLKYKDDISKASEAYYSNFLTPEEKSIIEKAYKVPKSPKIPKSSKLSEKVSENTRYRSHISRNHGGVVGDELDTVIDNMSDDEVLDILSTGNSYGQDYRKYIEDNPKKRKQMIANIKAALKTVGMSSSGIFLPDMLVSADDTSK